MDPERTSRFVSEGPSDLPLATDHTKFTARLQLVHMFSLQMTKYGGVMTRDRQGRHR
jgi:hypothetical protein